MNPWQTHHPRRGRERCARPPLALALVVALLVLAPVRSPAQAEDEPAQAGAVIRTPEELMTVARMGELIERIDPQARRQGNAWELNVEEYVVGVVFDENADRMRAIVPIAEAEHLDPALMMRLLQANYDSALDARYAVGQGLLWATFIHPLSSLTDEMFMLGLGQTVNIVATFGTSFSSGMFVFGGGDSADIERRRLLDKLREMGTDT